MSLIGPRPTLRYQVERYTERQRRRLDVLPGITGWAQIHGRAALLVGRADRARRLVRRAPLGAHRPAHPRSARRSPSSAAPTRARPAAGRASLAAVTAVLFTCAGQRVDIVSAFARAGATTIATDIDPLAPALYHADHHAFVPRIDDPGYVPALAALVEEHDVRLIVPLTDLDQLLLARSRAELEPALAARPGAGDLRVHGRQVPRARLLRGARDSQPARAGCRPTCRTTPATRCSSRCARASARATSTAPTTAPSSTSSSATRPSTRSCRSAAAGEEFSIDVFCDLDGRCLNAIPRTMIQSKGGESIKGMSIQDRELDRASPPTSPRRSGIVGPANDPVLPRAGRIARR